LEEKGFVDFGYWRLSPPAVTEEGYDERLAREHLVVFQVDTDPSWEDTQVFHTLFCMAA